MASDGLPIFILLMLGLYFAVKSFLPDTMGILGQFSSIKCLPALIPIVIIVFVVGIIRFSLAVDKPRPYRRPHARYIDTGVVQVDGYIEDISRNIHYVISCDSITTIGDEKYRLSLPTATDEDTHYVVEAINKSVTWK